MNPDQPLPPSELVDFLPMVQRVVATDPATFIRLRQVEHSISGFIQLPYDVIAGRTLERGGADTPASVDVTYAAADFIGWLTGTSTEIGRRDAHWLSALPPRVGWRRLEIVPDGVIRELIRAGAAVARDVTERAEQQSLLASPVLTVAAADPVEVPLRALTALTKLGFLPRDSQAAVDVAPGWLRVAATYGSTFISTSSGLLTLGFG